MWESAKSADDVAVLLRVAEKGAGKVPVAKRRAIPQFREQTHASMLINQDSECSNGI